MKFIVIYEDYIYFGKECFSYFVMYDTRIFHDEPLYVVWTKILMWICQ